MSETVTKVAPLHGNRASVQFFEQGYRRSGEPVSDYMARHRAELKNTALTFFLLDMAGISKEEQVRILAQAGMKYDSDAVQNAMEIQLAKVHLKERRGQARVPLEKPQDGAEVSRLEVPIQRK